MSGYVAKPLNQSPLIEFLLGSFHPDWMLNDTEAESVVRDFVRVHGPSSSEVDALIADIDEVLAEYPTDAKLRALIADHLVYADLGDQAADDWLRWLKGQLDLANKPEPDRPKDPPYSYGSRDVQAGYESSQPPPEPWGKDPWGDAD